MCATDASPSGYGVSTARWERSDVAAVGRLEERSRFKRPGRVQPRASALALADPPDSESDDEDLRRPDPADFTGCQGSDAPAGFETGPTFTEVPARLLDPSDWHDVAYGAWRFKEDIHVLEARALVLGVRRLALTRPGQMTRLLMLCDNMSVVYVFSRCRPRCAPLLRQIRRVVAYKLARNMFVRVRWIPSELNISGAASRKFE